MNITEAIGIRVIELLKKYKLSQYMLAKQSCLSQETIRSIMKRRAKGVNLKTIICLADGFKMTASEFLNSPLFNYDNLNLD